MPSLATVPDLEAVAGAVPDRVRADRLLEMSSAVVERWCGREFTRVVDDVRSVTVVDGSMRLPHGPVESVASIVDGAAVEVDADGYATSASGEVVRVWGQWACGTYEVTYTHGYDPIPDDVVLAVCQMAGRVVSGPGYGIRAESLGEASYTYGPEAASGVTVGAVERDLLAPYRRAIGSVLLLR